MAADGKRTAADLDAWIRATVRGTYPTAPEPAAEVAPDPLADLKPKPGDPVDNWIRRAAGH